MSEGIPNILIKIASDEIQAIFQFTLQKHVKA